MITGELKRLIREEIRREMNVILPGRSGTNTESTESVLDLFPGMPDIGQRPVMHPFGMVSRAPQGTIQVVGRNGDHVGNRMVLGHRDKVRPTDVKEGETVIYAADGKTVLRRINVNQDKIQIGSSSASEPLVLGNVMKDFAKQWIENWLNAPQIGICAVGPVYLEPAVRQKFVELLQTFVTDAATNIVSQDNFTERKTP